VAPRRYVGVGLLGYGNIGKEVFNYLQQVADYARVTRIAERRVGMRAPQAAKKLFTKNVQDVIADPTTEIIVELTGDVARAPEYMLAAIDRGKHVVTANKDALAKHWPEIMERAGERGVSVCFEATVGGGIPVVRAMQRHISSDEIESFAGILNGTCNFILTRMKEYVVRHMGDEDIQKRSLPLEDALAQAQRLGYAEPDPTNDVNGFDTKYKVAILANLAFETCVDPADIFCEGIWGESQRILPSDFYFLHHRRYLDGKFELKLVGVAERRDGRPALRVHPALIDANGELADLAAASENFNGIVIRGRRLGTGFLKGLGAGPKPTAISVASDVREIATSMLRAEEGRSPGPAEVALVGPPVPKVRRGSALGDVGKVRTRGFIRSFSPDVKGVYAKKLEILARHKVNVQSIVNVREFVYGRDHFMPDYIEIDAAPDGAVREALEAFRRMRDVRDAMYFRILDL
jgi:homoserine dehydrogenase